MWDLLGQHPDICMSRPKETRFFDKHWEDGSTYLAPCFAAWAGERWLGEASPQSLGSALVAERMARLVPEARFVVCVREPVERMLSHYEWRVAGGRELRTLDAVIAEGAGHGTVRYGCYGTALRTFLAHFPIERFCIVDLADVIASPQHEANRVFAFLGLDEVAVVPAHRAQVRPAGRSTLLQVGRMAERVGTGRVVPAGWKRRAQRVVRRANERASPAERSTLTDQQRARLVQLYAPEVQDFESLTGRTFPHWRTAWAAG